MIVKVNYVLAGLIMLLGQGVFLDAKAQDMKCTSEGAARCPCPASMLVKCEGYGQMLHIDDEQKVKAVTIGYLSPSGEKKLIVIKNPKSNIRSLYAPEYNDEVKAEFKKQGIDLDKGGDAYLDDFVADSNIPLYVDPNKSQVARKSGAPKKTEKCIYESPPNVVSAEGCGVKTCVAKVVCEGRETIVGCLAVDGVNCPSADACLEDPKVVFKEPKSYVGSGGSVSSSGSVYRGN